MILYHGTNASFEAIDLSRPKPNKDLGRGFYPSADKDLPREMAKVKVEQYESGTPTVMACEVAEKLMVGLKVLHFDAYSEDWVRFVLLNRNTASGKPAHDYDIVIGPIANDRMGVQLWRYETEAIDLATRVRNLQYIKV